MAVGRTDYEERKENRISRYTDKAKKASGEADALFGKAHDMASVIPFGQPILVGHHSEGRDRSYRKRIETTQRKSFEAAEKASYYADKAVSAATDNAISGDNPEAINLYKEKLTKLEAVQDQMKAVNKAFAKGDDALKALGLTDEQIVKMKNNMPSYERKPYPTWALSNNNAEIRRVWKSGTDTKSVTKITFISPMRCRTMTATPMAMMKQGRTTTYGSCGV